MIDMTKKLNIAIVGLGQIGNYLYNELNTKKKDILKKTGKIVSVSAISAKNINNLINSILHQTYIQIKYSYFEQLVHHHP